VSPGKQNRSDCTGDGPLQNQLNAKPKKQRRGQKRKKAGGNERTDKRLHSELEATETAEKKLLSALDAALEKVTNDEPPAVKATAEQIEEVFQDEKDEETLQEFEPDYDPDDLGDIDWPHWHEGDDKESHEEHPVQDGGSL
jgi:hypothetical protein